MPKKPASSRAYEHATLAFGLVSLQVSVFTGTDSGHGVKRSMFTTVPVLDENGDPKTTEVIKDDGTIEKVPVTEDHPVGYGNIDKEAGTLIPAGQPVIKKVSTEYGYVFVEDHEIEQLFELNPKTIEVREFQPQSLFFQGHYVPKSLYYIEAAKMLKGKSKVANPKAQQNLALILAAMKSEGLMAVVDFTTRGVPKPGVLMPDGSLWTVYHDDELREQRPLPEFEIPSEVAKAAYTQYIEPFRGDKPLDLEDKRTALIQGFADEKAKAGDFGQSEEPAEVVAPQGEGVDLMALLAQSVEQAKAAG